jgi:prepilin peptidase CpaA
MTNFGLLMCAPLFGLLAWAAVTDCASRRIPNWLTYTLILGGIVHGATGAGTIGVGASLLGMLLGFGLTFVFFAVGAMGGGDVKLLTGVGAWLGPWGVLLVFVIEAVVGMVQAVLQATAQKRLGAVLRNSAVVAGSVASGGGDPGLVTLPDPGGSPDGSHGRAMKQVLPYSVPVLIATAVVVAARWGGA